MKEKKKNENRWKTWKVTLGWLTVNMENALERKWNVISSRWKCVNFSSILGLESLWVVVFQKLKNRKENCMIIGTGRSKRRGSYVLFKLMPKRKASPQRNGSCPFLLFLLCQALSSAPLIFIFSHFPSSLPVLSYLLFSFLYPVPFCSSSHPHSTLPSSILSLPPVLIKFKWCWTWAQEEPPHWVDDTVRASFCILSHSALDRGDVSKSC